MVRIKLCLLISMGAISFHLNAMEVPIARVYQPPMLKEMAAQVAGVNLLKQKNNISGITTDCLNFLRTQLGWQYRHYLLELFKEPEKIFLCRGAGDFSREICQALCTGILWEEGYKRLMESSVIKSSDGNLILLKPIGIPSLLKKETRKKG